MGFIYCLTFPSGKKYVGKTEKTVQKRLKGHVCPSSGCPLVRNAYQKYKTFEVETILEVENSQLSFWEKHYIKEYRTLCPNGYNLTEGGEGGVPCEETRRKMRESQSKRVVHDHWRQQISKGLMGHAVSNETKEKIRQARLARPNRPSEDNRRKINERIRTLEVREKGSKNRRKDNKDLPLYVQTVRKKTNPGYCVQLPGQPQKHFTSKKLSMEEKLALALAWREENIQKLEKSNDENSN